MIPYVSIDLETTGLDPENDQILEFGAVIEDWVSPIEQLPVFHRYVQWDRISGSPRALAMNAEILEMIANIIERKVTAPIVHPSQLIRHFTAFLLEHKVIEREGKSFTAAGKNFAGFDRQFIKRLPGANRLYINHRAIDPAMLFWKPGEAVPGTEQCAQLAGLDTTLKHRAVDDAKRVIQMIRFWASLGRPQ
jgi:oligoribonuclease (3'-5' exoribonuclease)